MSTPRGQTPREEITAKEAAENVLAARQDEESQEEHWQIRVRHIEEDIRNAIQ
jgi:hypothetical protein